MRTDATSYVLGSENRKKIVRTIFDYPNRQWSCSALEELTKISHATVFRTLSGLKFLGVLKCYKINKKDLLYELVNNPITKELRRLVFFEQKAARSIARDFIKRIKPGFIYSVVLYGSTVKGKLMPQSDIDLLVILKRHDKKAENNILNNAAEISSNNNRTLAVTIMDLAEFRREKTGQYIESIKENMEVIYGETPF